MRKLLLLSTIALLPCAAAHADTIQGTYSINVIGNYPPGIADGGDLDLYGSNTLLNPFTLDDTLGATTGLVAFFEANPYVPCGTGCIMYLTPYEIDLSINFQDTTTGATGSYSRTGTYTATYTDTNPWSAIESIYWNDAAFQTVALSDGTQVQVYLPDAPEGLDILDYLQVTMLNVPDQSQAELPEPGTLAIFGVGLLGLVAARRRTPENG